MCRARRFLLASGSPRRAELLSAAGYRFTIAPAEVEEIASGQLTPAENTLCNAARKALAVARAQPDAVVLGADTLVALGREIIGKPRDREHAFRILRRLSGRCHVVYSAVFVIRLAAARSGCFVEATRVQFRPLRDEEIRRYHARIEPLDKAGAYAAQGDGAEVIARVEGSFTNVVGLPMERTAATLAAFGIRPRASQRSAATSGSAFARASSGARRSTR